MGEIAVIKVNVNENPEVIFIDESLEAKQQLVGGWLECVRITEDIDLWINEEGLLLGLETNFIVFVELDSGELRPLHEIKGNVYFASHDEAGNTVSLTTNQAIRVLQMFDIHRKALTVSNKLREIR